jgi:hypothetical protein
MKRTNRFSLENAQAMIGRFTPGYRLVRSLGGGSHGQVFLIEDELKQLAVKIVPMEFRAASGGRPNVSLDWARLKTSFNLLHHPALVRVRDFFRHAETDTTSPAAAYGLIYMEARQTDPLCQRDTGVRVRRGGSWSNAPAFLRSAQRGRNYPDHRSADIGFRLAIAPRR